MAEPAPAPAPAAATIPADAGLMDVLEALPEGGEAPPDPEPDESIPGVEVEGAKTDEGEEKPAKGKAPKKEPKPEKSSPAPAKDPEDALELDEALFADEALSTREGVARAREVAKAAADAVKERNRILDRYDLKCKRQDQANKRDRAALEQEKSTWKAEAERELEPMRESARAVIAELQILAPQSGANASQRMAALARLSGMDGRQFYEEVTLGIASDGKVPPPSRTEQQLQAQIAQLTAALQQKLQGDEDSATTAKVQQMRSVVDGHLAEIRTMASNAEEYPGIAAYVTAAGDEDESETALSEVIDWVKATMVRRHEKGRPVDKATAIGIVEARLAARGGGKQAEAADAAESGASPKPGSPARGAGKATTVLPNAADRSTGHVRTPKTQAERDAENARDPSLMAAIFGGI